MEMRNVKEDNFNVNLKDLLAECVRKLKYVLITALVFALLMAGVKAVKNVKAYKAGSDTQNEIVLSQQELAGVNEYLLKVNDLEKMKKYMEESPSMKVDAHNIDTINIQYYVNADESVSQELVIAYRNFIIRGGLVSALKNSGISIEENYLQELVTCDSVSYNSEVKNNIFNVIIYAADKQECYNIANKTADVLKAYQKTLSESVKSHDLEQIEMSYSKTTDISLDKRQKDNLDTLIETSELIGDMDDDFSAAQLAKIKELLAKEDGAENGESEAVQTKTSVMSSVVKYFVLGFALGAFLSLAVIVIAYIVSGKLKYINELQVRYGMRCFGGLSVSKKNYFKKLSDKWFYSDYPSDVMLQEKLILSKIASTVRNIELDEIAVVGAFNDSVSDEISKIVEKVNERGIKCEIIGDILGNADAIDMLCKSKKVILAEQIGKSRIRNINQELLMCEHQNVEVVGYFTVD